MGKTFNFLWNYLKVSAFALLEKETVDTDILVTSSKGDRKIMQSMRITSRPPLRKRKWNQLNQSWRTSTKVIPIEKTYAGHISMMNKRIEKEDSLGTWQCWNLQKQSFTGVLKKLTIFTEKHLCWSLFLIKLQTWRPTTLSKKTLTQVFSCEYCETFQNSFFYRTPLMAASGFLTNLSENNWRKSFLSRVFLRNFLEIIS